MTHKINLPQGNEQFRSTIASSFGETSKSLVCVAKFDNKTNKTTVGYEVINYGVVVAESDDLCLAIAEYNAIE